MIAPSDTCFDVIVVGAGPAGSSAALVLSRAGLRVAVLEKGPWPRYKTCGGGLVARTVAMLDLPIDASLPRQCHEVQVHHHNPAMSFGSQRQGGVAMVMRSFFDEVLLSAARAAGATFFAECPFRALVRTQGAWHIDAGPHRFVGPWLVAADGAGSSVAKAARLPPLREVAPALECEIEVDPASFASFSGAARFDFGLTPAGYGWVFPKAHHLSVGVLTTQPGSCNLNTEYTRYLRSLGLRPVKEERHGYLIPLRPRDGLAQTPGLLLVGDAAGLADPVTAEGIGAAVWSGQLAGKAIAASPHDDTAVRQRYLALLDDALLRDLRTARRLARVLYHCPRLRAYAFRRHGQRLADFMTNIVSGEARYRDLTASRVLRALLGSHEPAARR